MSQFLENLRTNGRIDGRMDRQTPFHTTLPTTTRDPYNSRTTFFRAILFSQIVKGDYDVSFKTKKSL